MLNVTDAPAGCPAPLTPHPAWLEALLRDGPTVGTEPHRDVVRAALGLLNCGHSPDDAYRLLLDSPGLGDRAAREGPGWLRGKVRLAERRHDASPANGSAGHDRVLAVVADLRGRLGTLRLNWPDLSDGAAQDALHAFLTVCERVGRTHSVGLSMADWCRGTTLGDRTVGRAKRALLDRGVLVLEAPVLLKGEQSRATQYRLDVPRLEALLSPAWQSAGPVPEVEAAVSRVQSHDAWVRGALGASRKRLWELLDTQDAQSPAQLAKRLPWKRRHVAALLEGLATYRLALRSGDGWVRCSVQDALPRLDEAAEHYGTAGTGDARHAKRLKDRKRWWDAYREYVAAKVAERSTVVVEYDDPATGERWVLDPDSGVLVALSPDGDAPLVLPSGAQLVRVDAPALWVDDDGPVQVDVAWVAAGTSVAWDEVPRTLSWGSATPDVDPAGTAAVGTATKGASP